MPLSIPSAVAAILGHGWLLYRAIELGPGQDLHLVNMLSLWAWLVALWIGGLSLRYAMRPLASILYPVTAVILWLPLLPYDAEIIMTQTQPWVLAHIVLTTLSFSLLGVAALQAIILGLQTNRLRSRAPLWQRMPSLEAMERCLFHLLWAGFILLSLGLALGIRMPIGAMEAPFVAKTLLSVLSWLVLAILLVGHHFYGWRGWPAVKSTLIGVGVLLIAYISSKGMAPLL